MENNKSLILTNTSIEKIEKQISIGDKILELVNQSFVMLTSKDFTFQIITLNDYIKKIEKIALNKKIENVFLDNLISIQTVNGNSIVMFFTKSGKYYTTVISKLLKVEDLEVLFDIDNDNQIVNVLSFDKNLENQNLIFATRNGFVKRTKINQFLTECCKSDLAIKLYDNDFLVNVASANDGNQIILGSKFGHVVRFGVNKIKPTLKKTYGKSGMYIVEEDNNTIIGLAIIENFDNHILAVTENGKVKKSAVNDFRITNRGGKGVRAALVSNHAGFITNIEIVNEEDNCLIITNLNNIFIAEILTLRSTGRATEPTNLFKLKENEKIISIIRLPNLNIV